MAASAPLPSGWSTKESRIQMLAIEEDNLRISYKGPGKTDNDAAAALANCPVPPSCPVFYFEVEILDKGQDGYIGMGLCAGNVSNHRLPGWDHESYGYHGDDGYSFKSCPQGQPYGPKYTTGDVVGCCYNQVDHNVFFTKNGTEVGIAFQEVQGPLFPTIGLRTPGEKAEANFGSRPFLFDIESFRRDLKLRVLSEIDAVKIPKETQDVCSLVLSWMVHNGYYESASSLARDAFVCGSRSDPDLTVASADLPNAWQRTRIREAVIAGSIDGAIAMTREMVPELFMSHPSVMFRLKCQKFVEMVRTGTDEELVAFLRTELRDYESETEENKDLMRQVAGLLAYAEPERSPMAGIMDPARRRDVADALNAAILVCQGKSSHSPVELLYSQAVVVQRQLKACGSAVAHMVDIDADLLGAE